MKKIVMVFIMVFSLSLLHAMKEDSSITSKVSLNECDTHSNEIPWNQYKELFFKFHQKTPFGTEKVWEGIKNGVLAGAIKLTAITQALPYFPNIYYFFAYSTEITATFRKTRFIYPCANPVYGEFPLKDTDYIVTVGTVKESDFVNAQWDTNYGIDNRGFTPKTLRPNPEFLPIDWQDGQQFWMYSTPLKNVFDNNVIIAHEFEKQPDTVVYNNPQ